MAQVIVRCRVLRPLTIGGRVACQSEILFLRPDDADRLAEAGYVEIRPRVNGNPGPWVTPTTR
jgi:hypothetical protein